MKSYFLLLTVLFTILTSSCKKSDPQPEVDLAQSVQGSYTAYYKKAGSTVTVISPTKPSYTVSVKLITTATKNYVTLRVVETLNGTVTTTEMKDCKLVSLDSGVIIYANAGAKIGTVSGSEMDIQLDINNLSTNFYATKD